ncbi:MAG: hypothetical protein QW625_03030 [Candidatus Nanoarchaeia archaeon]
MPLEELYEKLVEKAKEKNWKIEEALTGEQLPASITKFVRLSKVSISNRYEAKIIAEFKEEGTVECLYSVWERKENTKEFKEGATTRNDIIKFALREEEKIENYIVKLMDELNEKYFKGQFTRIRSKT